MSSKVQICNLALSRLGASRITSLSDNTTEAKLCKTFFDDIADEVMMRGPWNSTVSLKALNKTSNTPAFGFDSEFQLPTDPFCLRVLNINEDIPGTYEFIISGDKLLVSLSAVKVKYIGRVTDTEKYDPMLRAAIVSRLAAELSLAITGSASVQERMFRLYEQQIVDGLMIDGQQGSGITTVSPDLDEVR